MFEEFEEKSFENLANIKVIGVGGVWKRNSIFMNSM
jgi:hypothetical protein